jgi:diadenosine tetraphosphate (Ap4A) HIT family hydrolase
MSCALCDALRTPALYEDELWHVRHIEPPWAVAGWMLMIARSHVAGPAHFDDAQAAAFGPALRRFERALEQVSGALRIYTAALGELYPHFHAHMVPRYAQMPKQARGWGVFDLQRAAAAGEIGADPAEVERISTAYAAALACGAPERTHRT